MASNCDKCGIETDFLVDYPGYMLCQNCKKDYPFQQFSLFYNGITNCKPSRNILLSEFIEMIKQENPLVTLARTIADKKERDKIKAKMSYVTFGGQFSYRSKKNLIKGSGYACFDIDDLTNLTEIKSKLMLDKYVHLLFVSPSGNGLKVIVKIPEVKDDLEYKQYWISIANYFNLQKQDESCKDISRACYLSVDKEPYFNPNSEIYTDKFIPEPPKQIIISTSGKKFPQVEKGRPNEFLDKLLSAVNMESVLSHFGVDTTQNPTDCPFHSCSQRCLSFNSEVAHCFDTDCLGDDSWNALSFVKKVNNCDSAEAIKWLSDFAGMQEEYQKAKEEYFNPEKEERQPKGWGRLLNINSIAIKHNITECPNCSKAFEFNSEMGWFCCKNCNIYGGMKKLLTLARLKQQEINPHA